MDLDSFFYGLFLILPYLLTCLLPLLVLHQSWLLVRYAWQRYGPSSQCPKCGRELPDHDATCDWKPAKFPIFSALVIGACLLFFAVSFLNFRP